MYKLGTHNSMSYLKPLQWWHKPFHFISKCQNVSIADQYDKYNARYFDLRVKQKNGQWYFAHGKTLFFEPGVTIDTVCRYLNLKEDVVIRLVLEETKRSFMKEVEFKDLCERLVNTYTNITFIGFNTKADWEQLYYYENMPYINYHETCSSTTGNILDDWFPYLYAKTFNKNNYAQGTDSEYLVLDFINIK